MKPRKTTTITIIAIVATLAMPVFVSARPTDFREVSLWVRARETDQSIVDQVSQRKLMQALTAQEEATLKAQGASDSLVRSLRNANMIATPAEVAASEVRSQPRAPQAPERVRESATDRLQIFDVPAGHPVNLSEWGGPDYEIAFNVWRLAGDDFVQPVVIDTARTYTDVSTYSGPGFRVAQSHPQWRARRFTPYPKVDLQDNYYTNDVIGAFAASVSHESSREISIDRQNPVFIKDVPYALYPVYGSRGASLYYIGNTSDSVKLAIDTGR